MASSFQNKVAAVLGKVLPMSLYGCAVTPLPKAEYQRLRSCVATAMDPGAARSRSCLLYTSDAADDM
eukprot:13974942-Alexandrium_andersonii.AAC.1